MKLVNIISVMVRRDANTTTPAQIAEHELSLMRSVHGKEQVTVGNVVGQREIDDEREYGRLMAKYGAERMEKVYGDEESGKLESSIKAVKPVKGGKPKSESGAGTGEQGNGATDDAQATDAAQ